MSFNQQEIEMPSKKEIAATKPSAVDDLILDTLGTPPNFHSIQSVNVFGDYWRVNIRIAALDTPKIINTSRISDSFLVKISKNKIIESHPEITAIYKC